MHPLLETLKAKFPDAVLDVHEDTVRSELSLRVAADRLLEVGAVSPR